MSFSTVFKKYLSQKNVRQNQIVDLLSVTSGYIANLSTGKAPPPTYDNCIKITDFLNLNPSEKMEFMRAALKERLGDNWEFIVACGFTDDVSEGLMKVIQPEFASLLEIEDDAAPAIRQAIVDLEVRSFLKEFYELPKEKRTAFIQSIRGLLDSMK